MEAQKGSKLSVTEIKEQVIGKKFIGGYLQGFQYITAIHEDGRLEGKNNVQHYDEGEWSLNAENGKFSVKWQHG